MRTFSVVCALAVMVMVNSCYDDTDLKNSIDDLTGRVEELEKFREDVQSEISSLNAIIAALQENVTVDNVVSNEDGSYTINFSDGTSVTIKDGENGANGLTPPSIIVVEEDGVYYWAYENADGTTEFITDDDGERIPVTGVAPQVRINEDGFWEISTDGGQTWEETGMPSTGGSGALLCRASCVVVVGKRHSFPANSFLPQDRSVLRLGHPPAFAGRNTGFRKLHLVIDMFHPARLGKSGFGSGLHPTQAVWRLAYPQPIPGGLRQHPAEAAGIHRAFPELLDPGDPAGMYRHIPSSNKLSVPRKLSQ